MSNLLKEIKIRRPKAEEYPAVINCLFEVYNGNYLEPRVFDENYLAQSTKIHTLAAFNDDGQVISTIAVKQPLFHDGTFDLIMHTVRKKFRGQKIGSTITAAAIKMCLDMGCGAVYGHPVTAHISAQYQLEHCNMVPTGFLFNIYDSKKFFTPDRESQKQSLAVYSLCGAKKSAGTLYVPKRLESITRRVYDSLNIAYDISIYGTDCPSHKSRIDFLNDDVHQTLYIKVSLCGSDIVSEIRSIEREYMENSLQSVILYININDPNAPNGFESLLEIGYIFSGFSPLSADSEYGILFNPLNTELTPDRICVTPTLSIIKEGLLYGK